MKRTLVFVVAALLVTGAAFAQCPRMDARAEAEEASPQTMRMGMQQGPMGSMMGAMDTAVHDNFVYIVQGNMLEKRDMDGDTVESVQLDDMEERMQQMHDEGICPVCGMPTDTEVREGCPGGMMGGMHGRGTQDPGMHGGMTGDDDQMGMGMRHMQHGRMHSKVELEADADGVYLLRGGHFTKFDHDLNKVKSWDAVSAECMAQDDSIDCAMREMRRAECPTCRMMLGAMVDERGIPEGTVTMWHRPANLTPGMVRFQVQVDDRSGEGHADANVSGYLYPKDDVDAGMGVPMHSVGGGHFYGLVDVPSEGAWVLSLRVTRPGMEDARVYYDIPVE
ncbi:MAG: hypothetical protein ACOCX2_10100 [Armatimonadota bacterium]